MERHETDPATGPRPEESPEGHAPAGPQSPMPGEESPEGHRPAATSDTPAERQQGLDSPLGPRTDDRVHDRPPESPGREPAAAPESAHGAAAGTPTEAHHGEPAAGTATAPHPDQAGTADGSTPLLAPEDAGDLRRRWEEIQIGFVDEPRQAVQDADSLVGEVIRRLSESFSEERAGLEGQWGRGEDVATDDLRLTLQRYRSFFHRLLST